MKKVLIAEKRTETSKFGKTWECPRVEVWIDDHNQRIGNCNPDLQAEPHDWSSLKDKWVERYTVCRVCGAEVDEDALAWAYWRHQEPVCSTDCVRAEQLKRFACCDKAKPLSRNCVCMYATECPVHGERHHGTHD